MIETKKQSSRNERTDIDHNNNTEVNKKHISKKRSQH